MIASSLKAGTSWVQTIVFKLLFPDEKKAPGPMPELSPWVDLRVPERKAKMERIEAQKHRRFLKTHLPLDALPYHKNVKYVYVVRSGLDIFMVGLCSDSLTLVVVPLPLSLQTNKILKTTVSDASL